jgi:hypothetical protein
MSPVDCGANWLSKSADWRYICDMELDQPVEQAAAEGDPWAMTIVGKLALIGQAGARSAADGTKLLLSAAEKGSAEADSVISVLIAVDAKEQRDWSLALGYLQRAAERGWQLAREQLCLLSVDKDLGQAAQTGQSDNAVWEHLRDAINIPALLSVPQANLQSQQPRIAILKGFASTAECNWMIGQCRKRMAPARIYDWRTGQGDIHSSRTNSAVQFNILDTDFVLALLRARIGLATGFARTSFEETNLLHYAVGQEFRRHFDCFDPALAKSAEEIRAKGQRAATFLIYLNDEFEGAETDFPSLGWRHKGKAGDALFFMNVDETSKPDRLTLHAGLAPTSGEKWLLSQWIRGVPGAGL